MKRIFFLTICTSMFLVAFGQNTDMAEQIQQHLNNAELFIKKADKPQSIYWQKAKDEYLNVYALNPDIPEVYYQLCLCWIGLKNEIQANSWLKKYKTAKPNEKLDIATLENKIKELKDVEKINWRAQPLAEHSCHFDFEYTGTSHAPFKRGDNEYFTTQHTMNLGIGINLNPSSSLFIDVGAYYIDDDNPKFLSEDDYKWSFRLGTGFRYVNKYPLFCIGKLSFRYTGYLGTGVEYLAEGGQPFGGYDGSRSEGKASDFGNSFPYEISSGLLITNGRTPRGVRLEAFFRGHWQKADAEVLYKEQFGVKIAYYLGINL